MGKLTFAPVLVAILLLLSLPAASQDPPAPIASGLEESVQADRVIWPVFVRPGAGVDPGHCALLGRDDLAVRENGRRVGVSNLDWEQRPLIHAILLDVSGSMTGRLNTIREAAVRYVESLGTDPGEDRIAVLTFDRELVLRAPPTRADRPEARGEVIEAIRGIQAGSSTHLEDALYQLGLYLGSFAERSVVILLSDGESVGRLTAREAQLEYLESLDLVSLFSIGIDLPGGAPTRRLMSLARSSGGRHYAVRSTSQAAEAFDEIQETLAHRAYVTYVPGPPAAQGSIKVKIQSLDKGCKILYPPVRSSRTDDLMLLQGRNDLAATLAESDSAGIESRIRITLDDLVPLSAGDAEPSFFTWPPKKLLRPREAFVVLPDEEAEGSPDSLDELLLYWLLREGSDPRAHMIDGTTWIELRMQLARTLLLHEPRFRAIGQRRMEAGILRDLERDLPLEISPDLLARWTASGAVTTDQARQRWASMRGEVLQVAFDQRVAHPTIPDRKRRLTPVVRWLGDEHALDLSFRVETLAANLMLAGDVPAESWIERWPMLKEWLPELQVVTPLWLFRDRDSDAHGFYRIIYPWAWNEDREPANPISRRPFGLLVIDRLLAGPARPANRLWRVSRIRHEPQSTGPLPKKERKKLKRREESLRRIVVELTLAASDGADEPELLDLLLALGPEGSWRFYCLFEAPELHDLTTIAACPFQPGP